MIIFSSALLCVCIFGFPFHFFGQEGSEIMARSTYKNIQSNSNSDFMHANRLCFVHFNLIYESIFLVWLFIFFRFFYAFFIKRCVWLDSTLAILALKKNSSINSRNIYAINIWKVEFIFALGIDNFSQKFIDSSVWIASVQILISIFFPCEIILNRWQF